MTVVRGSLQVCSKVALAALCFGSGLSWAQAPKFTISTVAGTGTAGFAGDGGQASAANLKFPAGLAFDNAGNLYIADAFNSRIRKMAADGTITTIAGTGGFGHAGDDGPATKAVFNRPYGVALDASGNIYVVDTYGDSVRKIASSGNITVFAGNSFEGLGGDGGNATGALLDTPTSLAFDAAGNAYIADSKNNRIRKVGTDGKISTFAGTGAPSSTGDGGPAANSMINGPQGVTVDRNGNIYVAETAGHRVRKIAPDGTITTVAGNGNGGFQGDGGPATQASLFYPKAIAVDPRSGNLYIADWLNSRVRVVTPDGKIFTAAGNGSYAYYGDGGPATSAGLKFPWGLAIDSAGNVYFADDENSVIRKLTPTGSSLSAVPKVDAGGVLSVAAFGGFADVAPGSWIEIHGSNFADHARAWTAADFSGSKAPTSLDGASVTIGGQAAFISYISPNQINAQIPSGAAMGSQELLVSTSAGTSDPQTITVNQVQPGLLAPASLKLGDRQYTEAIFPDGSTLALPSGVLQGSAARPARPGETMVLYGIGFGPVTPDANAGDIVQHANNLILPFQVFIGGMPATVSYAGLAPGTVGLYQFNVVVPPMAPGDAVPLTFAVGGQSGQQVLYTAVTQ